jgi:hypothetical protein
VKLCCGYLRVYRPLEELGSDERDRIASVLHATPPPPVSAVGLLAPDERMEAYVLEVDGAMFVCPAQTRLRTLLGMVSFARTIPDAAVSAFFPDRALRAARRELSELRADPSRMRPSLLQSAWHVPLQWFVCFDSTERRLEREGDDVRLRYLTRVGEARTRVQDALDTLKGGIIHPAVVGVIFELSEWLAGFQPGALLELDYASLTTLFDPDELADDRSAADVWAAIRALGAGDGMKAALHYRAAHERWMRLRELESLN